MVVILLGCILDIKMLCGQHTIWCSISTTKSEGTDLREEEGFIA